MKILVLEGGYNEEHEVSLETAKQVKRALKKLNIYYESLLVNPINFEKDISNYNKEYLCFNALHGPFGEDGKIQNILEKKSFKYTHSDTLSSYIAFNKDLAKDKIKNTKILTLDDFVVKTKKINKDLIYQAYTDLGPFVIKPISSGSSFGINILKNKTDTINFIKNLKSNLEIYKDHNRLLFEKYIQGRELTVTVLEKNNQSIPIQVTELIPKNQFFDYQSKYTSGFCKHILPANIPSNIFKSCMEYARIAHDTIGCRGLSRSDFLYYQNDIYFLEINSQPGLTPISLVPEQLKFEGILYDELILNILNCAK